MTPLRVFAVDDERPALSRLAMVLSGLPGVELVGSHTSSRASIAAVIQLRPDVLLVDIAMPGLDGFELVDRLGQDNPAVVIFVTAFNHHAVSAFEADAVDYLLKPITAERLAAAISRARALIETRNNSRRVEELLEVVASYRAGERRVAPLRPVFWAYRNQALVKVPVDDLWWIAADGDYVFLHSKSGGGLMRDALTRVTAELDPDIFLRVHRSAVVRRDQIASLRRRPTGALIAELLCGDRVPVGRQYIRGVRDFLTKSGR